MFNNNSIISRNDLIAALNLSTKKKQGVTELQILDKNDEEELMNVLSDAFLDDPWTIWTTGFDDLNIDDEKKKELILKANRIMMGWMNRPILVRQKGIIIGAKRDIPCPIVESINATTNDKTTKILTGAIALMPSQYSNETTLDSIINRIFVGAIPFYTKEAKNYGYNADKRLESMSVLAPRRKELMKDINPNYVYIQTLGVLREYQGKGIGGKLLRASLEALDSLKIPAYLETESKENESLYQHFGFYTAEVLELEAEGTRTKLPMYLMIRIPK